MRRLPGRCLRAAGDDPAHVSYVAADGAWRLVLRNVKTPAALPEAGDGLVLDELRPAAPGVRALLSLTVGEVPVPAEVEAWWLHEECGDFYAALERRFGPSRRERWLVRVLVSLLGLPGMHGLLSRWHARRTA